MMPLAPTPEDREGRLAEALAAYLDLASRQETVALDPFCAAYGELAHELRLQIEALRGLDPVEAAVETPETLSGYRVLSLIGAGGMGRVFLADDPGLNRRVAIKTLRPELAQHPALCARFMHEARAMAKLNHPNIVRIYQLGSDHEPPHFVMEWIDGRPLTDAARHLTWQQKAALMRKVALAVEFLHRNHFVHRDLKPGNILLDEQQEPKLLDFGLALETEPGAPRLTLAGTVVGTPDYFSPEQAAGNPALDARSDVFALGAVFYEVLTGRPPFSASAIREQLRRIKEDEPEAPRRIQRDIPGELQNICMKALEKNPADRYPSAQALAADLERFLAGETVLAAPASYTRVMRARVAQHLSDLEGWMHDRLITPLEYDSFVRRYEGLIEREDAWILETRRLTLSQVTLYLGAWLLGVGAALFVLFRYPHLRAVWAISAIALTAVPVLWIGLRMWNSVRYRIAVAFLLAFCLLLPVGLVVALAEAGLLTAYSQGKQSLEFFSLLPSFRMTTNAQWWTAILLSLPAYVFLRRHTRAPVFSLVFAVAVTLFSLISLLRLGLLEWLTEDPGRAYFSLLPCAAGFFAAARTLEWRRLTSDSRYFYPLAVAFTLISLSGVAAFHEPYAQWLKRTFPWTRGQVEYFFIANAAFYLAAQAWLERLESPQLRGVAKAFRFVLPGHVMGSLLLLGISAAGQKLRPEERFFEVLLPAVASGFVFLSVPKQMKNFFFSGLLFLAVGIVRLQQDLLKDSALWPVALLAAGLALMALAAKARTKS